MSKATDDRWDEDDAWSKPELTIERALAIDVPWHGIEPCEDCGLDHMPVWVHVDFYSEDTPLAEALQARAIAISESNRRRNVVRVRPLTAAQDVE
jgi:hypothetical protein